MADIGWPVLRSGLFVLPPERAHRFILAALAHAPLPPRALPPLSLMQRLFGLDFPTPLGMAAGFDKNAEVPDALLSLGFGHVEIGTVTPLAQPGNPQPRVFRLKSDRALINRLGFNNQGHAAVLERLKRRSGAKSGALGIVGVNIGANKDSPDRVADFVAGIANFAGVADYFTVNVSSPNTPGLRDLQAPDALRSLLAAVTGMRQSLVANGQPKRPIVVKLAPDIAEVNLPAIVDVIAASGIDGIAVSNTTLSRSGLRETRLAQETGGLSGAPLFAQSTRMLAKVHGLTEGKIPLIGIGGIASGDDALAKLEAGASLIQLYTGLIYQGPSLVRRINRAIAERLDTLGGTLPVLIGSRQKHWAR